MVAFSAMCGFFEFDHNKPIAQKLIVNLGIDDTFLLNSGAGPASLVEIVLSSGDDRLVASAIWWLLLDRQTLKPSHYTSFNTRSDKLNIPRSAGYYSYRHQRCIIPATGIVEGEGSKGQRKYHLIEPVSNAFALGGLYKEWIQPVTGQHAYSCSVITLPPHPDWQGIHSKSTPLFLPHDDQKVIDHWLNPGCEDISQFDALMAPVFRDRLRVTPVDRPSSRIQNGDIFFI